MTRSARIPEPFAAYIKSIEADLRRGIATEYTYRSALETLLEALGSEIEASNDPKHAEYGAPDFVVERRGAPLGYLETKDIGADMNAVERSEQLKRYRASIHNLVLTDYLEFRRYVDGQPRETARLATVGAGGKLTPDPAGVTEAAQLLSAFYEAEVPTVTTPKELAERMARLTRLIRGLILQELNAESSDKGPLHRQYDAFKALLLPGLTHDEFADIYAQTMAYGLFAARLSAPEGAAFSRASAYQYLRENPFLRRLFLEVGEEFDGTAISPFLDDIVALLARADMPSILRDFGRRTGNEDPVVHFYETFLAAYDPKLRQSRGVYYTPEPVVQFIVNSVDWLLRAKFGRPWGLADPTVHLLDPATGTGTFLYFVIRAIHATLMDRGQGGAWQGYVHEKLLPRIFGFELLMAPYAIAHLKLGLLLQEELGYDWQRGDRLGVYLTNTLDEGALEARHITGLGDFIEEEAKYAAEVKHDNRIMVVLGNPPYSGHSANKDVWIGGKDGLVRDYYFVDGAPLNERNPKWLQDDYVKFIRFAEWRIRETGHGVLAFITNHGYLDNPTFRGMRRHLQRTFDEIYVLDLHGNSKKKERAPDGGKDGNVFDIQQGVAIILAVRLPDSPHPAEEGPGEREATVHHADLWGERAAKYDVLGTSSGETQTWTELEPTAPFYLFIPQDTDLRAEYEKGWKITCAMPVHSNGIVTARDSLTIGWSSNEIFGRVERFLSLPTESARLEYDLREDTQEWKVTDAQQDIREAGFRRSFVTPVLYRPFDIRFTYYTGQTRGFICRPRHDVMHHMLATDNLGLITSRLTKGETFAHVQVSQNISEAIVMSAMTSNNGFLFPLYLYTTPESTANTLFAQTETTRTPNLALDFIKAFAAKLGLAFIADGAGNLTTTFGPEDVFHYAYAIFHAPTYRTRYVEFLKIDFPRLPLTSDATLFAALVAKGRALVGLHLLTAPQVDNFITSFPIGGSNMVEKVQYAGGKVWINDRQYFGGVPEAVWQFKVGGYQVCDKWLKDRKGRALAHDDINHYQRVVVALHQTIRLMREIDAAIPAWPIT